MYHLPLDWRRSTIPIRGSAKSALHVYRLLWPLLAQTYATIQEYCALHPLMTPHPLPNQKDTRHVTWRVNDNLNGVSLVSWRVKDIKIQWIYGDNPTINDNNYSTAMMQDAIPSWNTCCASVQAYKQPKLSKKHAKKNRKAADVTHQCMFPLPAYNGTHRAPSTDISWGKRIRANG